MKNIIFVAVTFTSAFSFASQFICASMPHAEEAAAQALNLDLQSVKAIQGEDQYLAGGSFVMRKILVLAADVNNLNTAVEEVVVSYSIVRSFDGPDHGGDYCDLNSVETKSQACAAQPELQLCK